MSESRLMRVLAVCVLCAALCGCWNATNTRFPRFAPSDPRAESIGYRFHDPFPDRSAGPSTYTRPPSYMQQRDPARRAAENRAFQGYNLNQAPPAPVPPRSSFDYPDSVQTR